MRNKTFIQRRHEKGVEFFERSTVFTLLIPKHLVEKLDLVLPVVFDTATIESLLTYIVLTHYLRDILLK
jgi:hypothetical protein